MNSKTFNEVKKILDKCVTSDKRESIEKLMSKLKMTSEAAHEYCLHWRRDYMKGINIGAFYNKYQPISIIVETDDAVYKIDANKTTLVKTKIKAYLDRIPDEQMDLEKVRKDMVSNGYLGYVGNE